MISVEKKIKVSGKFEIIIKDKHGKVKQHLPMQNNMVLDNFFVKANTVSALMWSSWYLFLGTGTTPPVETDTKLENKLNTPNKGDSGGGSQFSRVGDTNEVSSTKTYEFEYNVGDVVGNISELGMAISSSQSESLITRSLVKDSFGNPTVITVTAEDQLIVNYIMVFKSTYEEEVSVVDMDFDGVVTPVTVTSRWGAYANPKYIYSPRWISSRAYSGEQGPIFGNNSGSNSNGSDSKGGDSVNGYRITSTWVTGTANYSGGIKSFAFIDNGAKQQLTIGVNPPIMKTDIQTLVVEFRLKHVRA